MVRGWLLSLNGSFASAHALRAMRLFAMPVLAAQGLASAATSCDDADLPDLGLGPFSGVVLIRS
jgi:hypothetical protein